MKLQMRFLLISIVIFSVSFLSGSMHAQGIYSKNKDSQESASSPKLRGGGPGGDPPGGNGDQGNGGGPGSDSTGTPIGEGWLILTALAGGYTVLKKRNIKKNEI
jgi:hypothetical protein